MITTANRGWALEKVVLGFAECTLVLGVVAQDGRIDESEQRAVIEVARKQCELMPELEQALLVQKARGYMEKHNTIRVPEYFLADQNQVDESRIASGEAA